MERLAEFSVNTSLPDAHKIQFGFLQTSSLRFTHTRWAVHD